jgi:hypothetical protein
MGTLKINSNKLLRQARTSSTGAVTLGLRGPVVAAARRPGLGAESMTLRAGVREQSQRQSGPGAPHIFSIGAPRPRYDTKECIKCSQVD